MFERTISFEPAFDKRHDDPAQDYGIGSVTLRFVLRGEFGAVEFMLFTNWFLPETRQKLGNEFAKPGPCMVTYHSPRPDLRASVGPCEYLDGRPCYPDHHYMAADPILERLLREGDAGVWAALEAAYTKYFEERHNDAQ